MDFDAGSPAAVANRRRPAMTVHASERVSLAASALLVIDVQDSFQADPARWARRNTPRFEDNVTALVAAWRDAGLPVVFVLHTDPDEGFARDSPFFRPMAFLAPRDGEPLIVKDTRNAFTSTRLGELLAERGVRRLVVCGISTEQCCETTTRVAADLGYDVDFVTEATLTFPIPESRPGAGDGLSADEIVRRTEAVLRGRFARLATVEVLRGQLAELPRLPEAAAACSA